MNRYRTIRVVAISACLLWFGSVATAQRSEVPPVRKAELGKTARVHNEGTLLLASQPSPEDLRLAKEKGIQRLISLRGPNETDWDEAAIAKKLGMEFIRIPITRPDDLTAERFDQLRKLLLEGHKKPTLLHCASANRVGAVWLPHRVLDEQVPLEKALQEAEEIGLRSPALKSKSLEYIQNNRKQPSPVGDAADSPVSTGQESGTTSVRPGINQNFLDPQLDVQQWLDRFETESREVFHARHDVVAACGLEPGNFVADVGAGTGLYTQLFAQQVGSEGWVFAVDIAPRFLEYINERTEDAGLENVTSVLGRFDSVTLPPNSVDFVFICDTYHHFEFPAETMRSIHRALRTGGRMAVIDFERIPGKSRAWVIDHVRAGKSDVIDEITRAGFTLSRTANVPALKENYFLIFAKSP